MSRELAAAVVLGAAAALLAVDVVAVAASSVRGSQLTVNPGLAHSVHKITFTSTAAI